MATKNPIEGKLKTLTVRLRDRIQDRLSTDIRDQCELCGLIKYRIDRVENETAWEIYTVDCPDCDCSLTFNHLYVEICGEYPLTEREFLTRGCGSGCSLSENDLVALIRENEPVERSEYHLPVKGILETMIHQHHVSYVPEETISVCSDCHSKIHHEDDFRPDLKPELSREEWKAAK